MEKDMRNYGTEERKKSAGTPVIIFLSVLAILLAAGGALLLREVLKVRYEAQTAQKQVIELSTTNLGLLSELDELEKRYEKLSREHQELDSLFKADRVVINQLRAQVRAGGTANIQPLRDRITELEAQLAAYEEQIQMISAENQVLASENSQIRTTLTETTARNTKLQTDNTELTNRLEKASILTISNLEGTGLRIRRRGDEPTTKASRTNKVRVCFAINQNLVATPGNRDFYIRLIDPANQVMSSFADNTFTYQGEVLQYSIKRTVNYQNNPQDVCVVWEQDAKFQKGYYNIVVFTEGEEVGYKLFKLD